MFVLEFLESSFLLYRALHNKFVILKSVEPCNYCGTSLSGKKNITMDMLLRSSASFKKAKSIATQHELEDTESQPVEFIPDSQVDP